MTANPQPNPVFPQPQRKTPQQIADCVTDHIRAGIRIIFMAVLGGIALAGAYIACRAILWGVILITEALGV